MALIRILRKLAPVHVTNVTLVTKILDHLKLFNPKIFTLFSAWNLTVSKTPFLWLRLRWIFGKNSCNSHLFENNVWWTGYVTKPTSTEHGQKFLRPKFFHVTQRNSKHYKFLFKIVSKWTSKFLFQQNFCIFFKNFKIL